MTIPTLINNYQKSVLENSFKKFNANLISAYSSTKKDFEIEDMNKYLSSSYPTGNYYTTAEANEFNDDFLSHFKQAARLNMRNERVAGKYVDLKSYSGAAAGWYEQAYGLAWKNSSQYADFAYFILSDGSAISSFAFQIHASLELTLTFDTNGPAKGPNQLGYDIFIYSPGDYWTLVCSKTYAGTQSWNGRGCYNLSLIHI